MRRLSSSVLAGFLLAWFASPAGAMQLVTEEEAKAPNRVPTRSLATPAPTMGAPKLMITQPQGSTVKSPFPLDVSFQPENGAQIAVDTLAVEYVKLMNVDLTPRLRPYASEQGIAVRDVNLPPGRHTLRISVADNHGRRNTVDMQVSVQ
ncbi:MAG: hypothetical protein ABT940_03015 [Alphaproteobacteria bacterium]